MAESGSMKQLLQTAISSPSATFFHCALAVLLVLCAPALRARGAPAGDGRIDIDLGRDLGQATELNVAGGVVARTRASALVSLFERAHFESTVEMLHVVTDALRTPPEDAGVGWQPPILSGNLAGGLHYGRWPEAARFFDCLNNDLNVAALPVGLGHFLGIAALSDAIDTTSLIMPSAASNRAWNEQEDPLAYARGTGLTYALGGHMHIPWCLYDGSQNRRFYGSQEGHHPIFRMIHENRTFLDGYVAPLWHVIEVPYGPMGVGPLRQLEQTLEDLFEQGIPATVRFRDTDAFGDDRFFGTPVVSRVLGTATGTESIHSPFHRDDAYNNYFLPPLARVSAEESHAPLVLHLVRQFNGGIDQPGPATFRVSSDWLPASHVRAVSIASIQWPGQPDASVRWRRTAAGDVEITVEQVGAWAMVRVETDAPVRLPGILRSTFREQMPESEIPVMRMIRFADTWQRPPWVDDALRSEHDPLDGYHVDRITWSYEDTGKELAHALERGWDFHGSVALMHTHMGDPHRTMLGIIRRMPDWSGWARYPDGQPMLIRADWCPPRFGASFAAPIYHEAVLDRCREWLDMGVTGIQFDDVMGMLNRVWQYGGDFSDALFEGFRTLLQEQGYAGITNDTPLDELRARVIEAMQWENAARVVNVAPPGTTPFGWLSVPYRATSVGYPGEVRIGPAAGIEPVGNEVVVEYEVRFRDGDAPGAVFLLMDEYRSVCLSRLDLGVGDDASLVTDAWITIKLKYDLQARTLQYAVGATDEWSEPLSFSETFEADEDRLAVMLMANPLRCGLDIRRITVLQR